MSKFELVGRLLAEDGPGPRTLLDVGCRTCDLREHLPDNVSYSGLDLYQNAEQSVDFVLDVENGLPMEDGSYDYVVGLDVLEHLNDLHGALAEMVRVARRRVIVILPNLAHLFFRLKFFREGQINGKYVLQYGGGQDRHRWLTVLPETDEYLRCFARDHGLLFDRILLNDSPKKRLLGRAGRALRVPPSWWVWAACYDLKKQEGPNASAGGGRQVEENLSPA